MGQNLFKKIFSLLIIFTLATNGFVFAQKERMTTKKTEKVLPPFEFIQPKEEAEIKGEIKIKGKVKDANSVEFYYQSSGAILAVYLGKAQSKGENLWEYSWNTNLTPNGNYKIFAKIKNQFGEYKSPKINIKVENEIQKEKEKEEKLKEEIKIAKEEIKKEEKEITEKKEETKEKTVEKIDEITKEVVLPKIEQHGKKIEEEVKKNVEKFAEKIKEKEEKEEVKKTIIEKANEIIKPIEEVLSPEEKSDISKIKKEAEKKIIISLKELEEDLEKKEEVKEKVAGKIKEIHKGVVLPKIKEKKEEAEEKIKKDLEAFTEQTKKIKELESKIKEKERKRQGIEEKIGSLQNKLEKINAEEIVGVFKEVKEEEEEPLITPPTPTPTPPTPTPPTPAPVIQTTGGTPIVSQKTTESLESSQEQKQKTQTTLTSLTEEVDQLEKEKEQIEGRIIDSVGQAIKPIEKVLPASEMVEIPEVKKLAKVETTAALEDLEKKVKEKEEIKIEKSQILLKDSDNDGLSDEEEIKLGTNPFNPDSDGDGFLDGIEIETGYDSLKAGPADKIIYQDPRKVLPKKAEIYRVEKVEKVILPSGEMGLKFSGKGLPNSFVTLYIFSLPIVIAVKTDQDGHWKYTLDKSLADGEHRVYAALTNNHGQIEARSETFVFVKAEEKIFRIFETPAEVVSPVGALQKPFIILILAIIILALGIALIIISLLSKKKIEKIRGV